MPECVFFATLILQPSGGFVSGPNLEQWRSRCAVLKFIRQPPSACFSALHIARKCSFAVLAANRCGTVNALTALSSASKCPELSSTSGYQSTTQFLHSCFVKELTMQAASSRGPRPTIPTDIRPGNSETAVNSNTAGDPMGNWAASMPPPQADTASAAPAEQQQLVELVLENMPTGVPTPNADSPALHTDGIAQTGMGSRGAINAVALTLVTAGLALLRFCTDWSSDTIQQGLQVDQRTLQQNPPDASEELLWGAIERLYARPPNPDPYFTYPSPVGPSPVPSPALSLFPDPRGRANNVVHPIGDVENSSAANPLPMAVMMALTLGLLCYCVVRMRRSGAARF